jgi:hypothetical protein
MDQRQAIGKIKKLLEVSKSHREQGQIQAANAYACKAKELMTAHGITRAMLKRAPVVEGTFSCSCGFSIQMKVDAGDMTDPFVNLILGPHQGPGHFLKRL